MPAQPRGLRQLQLFELHGYMRMRADYFHRLDLGLDRFAALALRRTVLDEALLTAAAAAGVGSASDQRPATASAYDLPAELGLAATTVTSNHGWLASSDTKRCPTMPVAPKITTLKMRRVIWFTPRLGSVMIPSSYCDECIPNP